MKVRVDGRQSYMPKLVRRRSKAMQELASSIMNVHLWRALCSHKLPGRGRPDFLFVELQTVMECLQQTLRLWLLFACVLRGVKLVVDDVIDEALDRLQPVRIPRGVGRSWLRRS